MKKSEKNNILAEIACMSDADLEQKAYDAIYDCLGSQADVMEEQCWDEIDIMERRKYEKFLSEKADIYEMCCDKRGIRLFEQKGETE